MVKRDRIITRLLSRFRGTPLTLGVETSKHAIKMALVRQESSDSATLLDYAVMPLAARYPGAKFSPASIIGNVLSEKRLFTATEVRLVISGPELDSKRIALPFMPEKEIAQALRLEAKDHFLLDVEGAMLDFEVLEEKTAKDATKHIELIANLAKNKLIDEKISFFKNTQLPPSVVIPVAYGLYNLYRLHTKAKSVEPVALIDIGDSTTTIVIIKDDKIRFIRQLGCAGKDFTNAMVGTLVSDKGKIELSSEEAEELKIMIGIPEESNQQVAEAISPQQVRSMLRPVIEKLASDIRWSFNYYASQFNEGKVTRVYLTGGSSKMKNMHTSLSHRLKDVYSQLQTLSIPVRPFEVPEGLKINLTPERAKTFKEDFPIITPAIGAALSNPEGVNLIPASYKALKIERIRKLSIRIVFIIISLILLTYYLFNLAQEKLLQNLLAAKRPQWQELQEIQELHSKIVQKNAIIEHTLKNQVPLYYIFKALSNLTPKPVYLENLIVKDKASTLKMEGVVLETTEIAELTLARFVKALEDSPFFNNVHLASSQDTEVSGRQALEFEISCKLENR